MGWQLKLKRLWVATNQGLFMLEANNIKATQVVDKPNGGPLNGIFIKSICSDFKNAIWVGYTRMLLPALKWGTYKLQFKAIGAGEMESDVVNVSVIIQKPFWVQPWFMVTVGLLVLGTLYFLYRYRLQQLRRTIEVRNTISQNLHDDIGASLSNIQMLNELTRRNLGDKNQAEEWLGQSDEDIRQVSESISDIVWNVNPRYDDLNNLFIRMKRYAADQLEAKNIQATLVFPENTVALHMPMEQRRDFYLIFKEAMHNMVKYSNATEASFTVLVNQRNIILLLTDNGKGFDKNNMKDGNGMENMQKRASKWKGSLQIESTPGPGTKLQLMMPVS